MPLNQSEPDHIRFHDRLDLKLHTMEYSDQPCGSLNIQTGKPQYCCAECPTLREKILNDYRLQTER